MNMICIATVAGVELTGWRHCEAFDKVKAGQELEVTSIPEDGNLLPITAFSHRPGDVYAITLSRDKLRVNHQASNSDDLAGWIMHGNQNICITNFMNAHPNCIIKASYNTVDKTLKKYLEIDGKGAYALPGKLSIYVEVGSEPLKDIIEQQLGKCFKVMHYSNQQTANESVSCVGKSESQAKHTRPVSAPQETALFARGKRTTLGGGRRKKPKFRLGPA